MSRDAFYVFITPYLPEAHAESASQTYLNSIGKILGFQSCVFIAPDTPKNREISSRSSLKNIMLISPKIRVWEAQADLFLRFFPVRAPIGFVEGIRQNNSALEALRQARLVDVHHELVASNLKAFTTLAPQARILATLHDIDSQRFFRKFHQEKGFRKRLRWLSSFVHAKIVELYLSLSPATLVVLSEKDRVLLGSRSHVEVLRPLSSLMQEQRQEYNTGPSDCPPRLLFVGPLYRQENFDAMKWFTEEIWPEIRRHFPSAVLEIVGIVRREQLNFFNEIPGLIFSGYIEDLYSVHLAASVVIVPLRFGAGVKFKTLDAIAAGVPLVTTSVGAEGIGDELFSPTCADTADDFASSVVCALRNREASLQDARAAALWVRKRYGLDYFTERVKEIYFVPET